MLKPAQILVVSSDPVEADDVVVGVSVEVGVTVVVVVVYPTLRVTSTPPPVNLATL